MGKGKVPNVEGNFWTLRRQDWTGKKNLFISGCISQSSVRMHVGVHAEPSWGLVSTEHTGQPIVGALAELLLSSFRTRMEYTYPTRGCSLYLVEDRTATGILSCRLSHVFLGL